MKVRLAIVIPRFGARIVAALLACAYLGACGSSEEDVAVRELYDEDYAFGVDDYLKAVGAGDVAAVRRFLDAGMGVDVTDSRGERALLRVASSSGRGTGEVARLLLSRKASVEGDGEKTRTPLIVAAGTPNAEVVSALLDAGADPFRRDPVGWTALTYAAAKGDARCVEILAPVSAPLLDDALLVAALHGRAELVDVLAAHGASVQARSTDGSSALMLAAGRGHRGTVELLLHRGANRFALDEDRRTAAERALDGGFPELAVVLSEPPTRAEVSGDPVDPLALYDPSGRLLGQPAVDGAHRPARLNGARLKTPAGSGRVLAERTRIREYRERQLPFILKDVAPTGDRAELRLLFGNHSTVSVPVGGEVAGSGLRIVAAKRAFKDAKDSDSEKINASHATLEDAVSSQQYELAADEIARSSRTGAVLDFSGLGEDWFEARRDDEFTVMVGQGDGEEQDFRILDVRPDQVLIECAETGEVFTVPRER